jgi:predicted ribosomally synthesized peptide with nif11-like leader
MSAEGATAFFERVTSDEQFRTQLEAAETPDDKHRIVTDAGYDLSRDDLSIIRNLAGMNELSDEDLEKVAGGAGAETWIVVGGGSVVGSAAVAAIV